MFLATALSAACGGDDNAKDVSSGSPAPTTPAGEGGSPTATATGQALAEAGPDLSAYQLLTAAGFPSAAGPVTAAEDDGVFPDQNGCVSGVARGLTASALLQLTLSTLPNAEAAQTTYQEFSYVSPGGDPAEPVAGGDIGSYANGNAVVMKGSQVLLVRASTTADSQAQLDQIKLNGGDPSAQYKQILAAAKDVASALAAKMSGASCSGPALGVPAGAVSPCFADPSGLDSAAGVTGTTASPVPSDQPPYFECIYRIPGYGDLLVYSATNESLQHALQPTTAADLFAGRKQGAGQGYETFASGRFQAVGSSDKNIGIDDTVYIDSTASAAEQITDGVRQVLFSSAHWENGILHMEQTASEKVLQQIGCEAAVAHLLENFLASDPDRAQIRTSQDYKDALEKLDKWCDDVTDE